MDIRVRYHGIFAQMAGRPEERLALPDGASINDALRRVARQHPALAEAIFLANGTPAPYARPFVNNTWVGADGLSQPLRAEDELALLPALSGGSL